MERWRDKEPMGRKVSLPSLVPRPTCAFHCSAAVGLVYFPRAWCEGEFLHGRGQLQFSDNKGRQRIYTSCNYSSEPICATDQVLKQCHQQKVDKCNRLSNGPCPRAIK